MREKRTNSAADIEVAQYLAGRGCDTSPRQVRTWRTEGLLDKAERKPQGYARPVLSENTPGTFERAETLARLTGGKRMSLDHRVLTLFFEGHDVPPMMVRTAFVAHLVGTHKSLKKWVGNSDDPLEIQETILNVLRRGNPRTKIARFLYKNVADIQGFKGPVDYQKNSDLMSSVLTPPICFLLGIDVSVLATHFVQQTDAIDEMIQATKLDGIASNVGSSDGDKREKVREFVFSVQDGASLMELASAVEDCTYEDLRWLSKVTCDTLALAKARSINERRLHLPENTSGISAAVNLDIDLFDLVYYTMLVHHSINRDPDLDRDDIEQNLSDALRAEADLNALLDAVGTRLHRIIGSGGDFERFPNETRAMLKTALERFAETNPEIHSRLLNAGEFP